MDLTALTGVDADFLQFINLEQMPRAILIVVIAVALIRLLGRSLDSLGERLTDRRLLFKQIFESLRLVLMVAAMVLVVATLFEFSGQAIYGVAGLVVLGLGYATRDLISSITAGFVLMFDQPFQVGDRVAFGEHYGEVTEIGLRKVQLVDLDDNLISIPNSRFLSDVVASANAGALDQMCVFDIFIGCGQDVDHARLMVHECAASSRYVFLGKPINVAVSEGPVPGGAERFAVCLKVRAYVFDGRYEVDFGSDLHRRVMQAFTATGIETAGEREHLSGTVSRIATR